MKPMDEIRLTPEEARRRFGDLRDPAGAHRMFEEPEGEWRPEFDKHVKLIGYRLYPPRSTDSPRKVLFRNWRPRRR